MGHTSDYVATEPWMYGKEDPCAGPGWRERTARKGQNPTQKWKKKKKGLHGSLKQLRCNETQPR
jgi:hypothetical protein